MGESTDSPTIKQTFKATKEAIDELLDEIKHISDNDFFYHPNDINEQSLKEISFYEDTLLELSDKIQSEYKRRQEGNPHVTAH
ncbi:MAG: hypothetical protein K6L81_17610 [Agarilytica sp.]